MSKPCEYCDCDLPVGVDKKTRQVRSHHFDVCTARPKKDGYEAGKREWVGLTDEEYEWCGDENFPMIRVAEMLKEKNHD